jgi:large subunit ribosomal protein L10
MPITKKQKKEILEDLKEKIKKQKTIIFVDFKGLKVKDVFDFRKKLRKADSLLKVSKKTLFRIALKDLDSALSEKIDKLEGQIGLIFGFKDEISAAKVAYNFSKEKENLKILGGFFEGKIIDKETVAELAKIPGREELLGRLVGTISAPITNFACVLQGNIKGLICVLSAIKK